MKRRILYILSLLCVFYALVYPFMNVDKTVSMKQLEEIVEKYINKDTMQEIDNSMMRRNYKIASEEYEGRIAYGSISYMDVEEIVIIKQTNPAMQKVVEEKIQTHITQQITSFEGYGERQTKMLKNAYVEIRGDYIICIVDPEVEKIKDAIDDCF